MDFTPVKLLITADLNVYPDLLFVKTGLFNVTAEEPFVMPVAVNFIDEAGIVTLVFAVDIFGASALLLLVHLLKTESVFAVAPIFTFAPAT